ncbi:MAG: hypothetical protein OK455_02370 [Thaumarchaeota archaeon]|nr:hypothetical protein [Nitrososphaerota archaeon]
MESSLGNASKTLETASKTLQDRVEKAGTDLREEVERGKKAVKEHPNTAVGIALGATFAAGVVAGAEVSRMRKNHARQSAKGKAS